MASLRGEALGGTRPPKNCYGLQETESSRLDYTQLFTRPNSPTLNIFLKSVYTCDITGWDCHPGAWNKPLTVCASGYPLLIRSSFSLMFRQFKGLFTRHDCRIRLFILVYLINWLESDARTATLVSKLKVGIVPFTQHCIPQDEQSYTTIVSPVSGL